MEAEYVALSTAMKDMIPMRRLVIDVCRAVGVQEIDLIKISSDVWEDNQGALILAKLEPPRMTPRSKHYGIKYHWFREIVHSPEYNIKLNRVDTITNLADIFTKGLAKPIFEKVRKLLNGW